MFKWKFGIDGDRHLTAVKDGKSGKLYFSLYQAILFSDIAPEEEVVAWAQQHIPDKWLVTVKIPGMEEDLFLTKSGLFYVLCAGKSQEAIAFRDWVFEYLIETGIESLD